jgi:predicted TIM-barrel fold metal-dependent hydrolase
MQSDLREELLSKMADCGVIDCHSHTRLPARYYAQGPYGVFSLNSYFERDMVYMLPIERFRACKTDDERWPIFRAALEKGRNMTYWRHNIVTYQKYFGLKDDDLTDENWSAVNNEMKRRTADPDWYDYVSRRAVKIKTQIRNIPWFDDWFTAELVSATDEQIRAAIWQDDWDKRYFTGVLRMENALFLHRAPMREQLAARTKTNIVDMTSLEKAIARLVDMYLEKGAIGIKLAHAYFRTLESEPVEQSVATEAFARALRGETLSPGETKQFQDYLIFYMAGLCRERDILFQIHTGLQHCFADLRFCNPLLLTPLLTAYKDVRFDLFHAGIPFIHEFGVLCKLFPNTYANMAWTHEISAAMSRAALSEYIDLIPGHRLLGFGSDVKFPELIGGALDMAFSVTADVLADKVERDFLSRKEADALINKMFYQNGCELYRL